jgi:hypothetical protein
MAEFAPYRARPVSYLGELRDGQWRLKVYGVSSRGPRPAAAIVKQSEQQAVALLAATEHQWPTYGAGFLIVHEANDGNFFLLNWWTGENMLASRVFYAGPGAPLAFEDFSASRIACCVWELEVMKYERDLWVTHVLAEGRGDINGYMEKAFQGEV